MVRLDHDGTTIARAAIAAARPDPGAARHGPKATAAGPLAARDRIFAGGMPAIGAHRRCRCPNLI
jgi:uncharacterized Zn-binding protein involved in type VI secretion